MEVQADRRLGRRFSERTADRGGIRDPLGGSLASGCARGTPHSQQNQCVREGSYQRFVASPLEGEYIPVMGG